MPHYFNWPQAVLLPVLGLFASEISAAGFAEAHAIDGFGLEIATSPLKKEGDRPTGNSPVRNRHLTAEDNRLPDGIYLYGESPQPEQIQKAYLVFEVRRGLAIGAVYMPSSSFDCFYGTAQAQQLELTIVSSYEQTSYPYTIPLQKFYAISTVSSNDQRILSVCKDSYQKLVWGQENW